MDQAVTRSLYFQISKILLMPFINKVELIHLVMSFLWEGWQMAPTFTVFCKQVKTLWVLDAISNISAYF